MIFLYVYIIMKKLYIATVILAAIFFLLPYGVVAKTLPQAKAAASAKKTSAGSSLVGVTPRLRKDRKALVVYFRNLGKVRSVSYALIYQTNGKDEGAMGSVDPAAANSTSRELLFGTCSAGVCRYHTGITNMRFEVTIELLSGKKYLRRFRIKV